MVIPASSTMPPMVKASTGSKTGFPKGANGIAMIHAGDFGRVLVRYFHFADHGVTQEIFAHFEIPIYRVLDVPQRFLFCSTL